MNAVLERLRQLLATLSPLERLLLGGSACVISLLLVNWLIVLPLKTGISNVEERLDLASSNIAMASRAAHEIVRLKAELIDIEAQIQPGEKTNLFTLLESMADEAGLKERLVSVKPRQAAGTDQYREDRVDVQLKGISLDQTVHFLHQIQHAPIHLIVRSVRIKPQGANVLDVSLSVSSFTRS